MKPCKYNTTHDQANHSMTHSFDNGVKIIINWNHSTCTIDYMGKIVDVFSLEEKKFSIDDHERLIERVSRMEKPIFPFSTKSKMIRNLKKLQCHEL